MFAYPSAHKSPYETLGHFCVWNPVMNCRATSVYHFNYENGKVGTGVKLTAKMTKHDSSHEV